MIIPDVNLLVYAYNSGAPHHRKARRWWEDLLSSPRTVGLPWAASLGFVRLLTSRAVVVRPLSVKQAVAHVRSWLSLHQVQVVQPGARHLDIIEALADAGHATGPLMTDVHLAAIAIEQNAELHSNDSDFGRFPGLRWINPLDLVHA